MTNDAVVGTDKKEALLNRGLMTLLTNEKEAKEQERKSSN